MRRIAKNILPGFLFLLIALRLEATHNRAGEIIIEQIGGCTSNTVRATIITYTKTSSVAADRDSLTICWGDGKCETIPRANGCLGSNVPCKGVPLPNDVKYNLYYATHVYSGTGRYTISMTDPNRNGGILNVNPPSSDNVQFHLQTTFTLFNGLFQGCNSSPQLLNPPVDYACVGQPFIHNVGAYDPDGDSLSYQLIVPLQAVGTPVPNYTFPQNIQNPSGCCLTLNPKTGTVRWENPVYPGEYNLAMIIISWRNGQPIDTTLRDMQILVYQCQRNRAPEVNVAEEHCVIAGNAIQFNVTATDPDVGDKLKLSALGAPFNVAVSPADNVNTWRPIGNPSATYQSQPVSKTFRWLTACEHISDLPYTVVFKAEDDFFIQSIPNSTGLASLKAVRIKVVGPPPADVQAKASSENVKVSWSKPYVCENAKDDFFFGFSVWRRDGSNPFPPDSCTPGLIGRGYTRIANTLNVEGGRYSFTDTTVERGKTYCYRILARFAKRTGTGQPYNFVESMPSAEVCVQLSRDVPLITNVSVLQTATNNGEIQVKWTKPLAQDLDTILNPGPYRYELQRTTGFSKTGFSTIATFISAQYYLLNQTEYLDQAATLNTKTNPYTYQLVFYTSNRPAPLGTTAAASSLFLTITPTDKANILKWKADIPWVNNKFTIFRQRGAVWDSIGVTSDSTYIDAGLENSKEYCYYVRSEGSYGIGGIISPLINLSQIACNIPYDNVPPCAPKLSVRNICDDKKSCDDSKPLLNYLDWTNPRNHCKEGADVASYKVYFASIEGDSLKLIATINKAGDTTYQHKPERGIAGCYAVTALDSNGNESAKSNIVCVDNCPNFTLPNAFTPNGDGQNDLFTPYSYCFIKSIDLLVYNRWGELVFKTSDPDINWNGENLKGKELAAGTYFYTCKVIEQRVSGDIPSPNVLKGYIDIIR